MASKLKRIDERLYNQWSMLVKMKVRVKPYQTLRAFNIAYRSVSNTGE